jgi:hypothetical protein
LSLMIPTLSRLAAAPPPARTGTSQEGFIAYFLPSQVAKRRISCRGIDAKEPIRGQKLRCNGLMRKQKMRSSPDCPPSIKSFSA